MRVADMRFTGRGEYYPTVYVNDFWLLRERYVPINESVAGGLNLTLAFSSMSLLKWQLFIQLEQSFEMQMQMGAVSSEIDEVRVCSFIPCACAAAAAGGGGGAGGGG